MNGSTDYLQLGGLTGASPNNLAGTRFSAALMGAVTTLPATYNISQFPTWTSAGTVQSVGLSAVYGNGTPAPAPTITASTINEVRYRQLGPKEWEVQTSLFWTNGTSGDGYYLLTLPAGLQFDLSSSFQRPYTANPDESLGWLSYALIGGWVKFSQSGAATYQESSIIPYDATRYRIQPVGPNADFWRNGYYTIGGNYTHSAKWGFTFFTP
jgi:hypothetical protein